MLLQLRQSLKQNVAIGIIQFTQFKNVSFAKKKKKRKRHVPMQLSIRTLENQAVLIVHPGTSIQQPITAKTAKKSHLLKL